jgi:Flp pilus assembly pilin Flp
LSKAAIGHSITVRVGGPEQYMDQIKRIIMRVREYQRGQTMTEYALILAAVAVVVFGGYQLLGTDVQGLLTSVDGLL